MILAGDSNKAHGDGFEPWDVVPTELVLFLSKNQIHDPAPANVRPVAAAMAQDGLVLAAGVHQRVGEDRHSFEGAIVVDTAG